jgi:ribosomal protein L7Ae-like RNA K-turn-binding protein
MADVTDTHKKQREVSEFLLAEDVSPTEIQRHLNSVYGEHTTEVRTVTY